MEEETKASKAAIEKVISLPGNHACRNDPEGICRVTSSVGEDMIFVNNKKHPYCPYYKPFGYSGFCDFSARKELYRTYNI